MKKLINGLPAMLFLGSAWGLSEMMLGGYLYSNNISIAPVILGGVALLFLAISRVALGNLMGSAVIMSIVAIIFRFANAEPFYCHFLGIFLMGMAFETVFDLLSKKLNKFIYVISSAVFTAYLSNALFVFFSMVIFQSSYWGISKSIHFVLVDGTLLALVGALVVSGVYSFNKRYRFNSITLRTSYYPTAAVATLAVWLVGYFLT